MNLKAKIHVENQKNAAENRLAVRLEFLKERGSEGGEVQRDPVIKKIRAEIRKANYRLASIAAQEKLNAGKAKIKAEKLAKAKSNREKAPEETPKPASKKKVKPDKAGKPEPVAKEKVKPDKAEDREPVAKEKVKPDKAGKPEPVAKEKVKPDKAEDPEPVAKEKVKPDKAGKPEPVAKEKVKPEKKKGPSPAAKSEKQE